MPPSNSKDESKSAQRSSIEIRDLLRKLHPERGSHKDRIRRLNKFRNYVSPMSNGVIPEFFDDDIPFLYLGAETPAMYLDEDDEAPRGLYYGLMLAAGMVGDNGLKRSSRHAMNLLKYLVVDYPTETNTTVTESQFSKSFGCLPLSYYKFLNLNLHLAGSADDNRSAKEDACRIIVFLLSHHTEPDQETPRPIMLEELVTTPQAQQAYDLWSATDAGLTVAQAELIKKNTMTRQAEIAMQQRQEAVLSKVNAVDMVEDEDDEDDQHDHDDPDRDDSERPNDDHRRRKNQRANEDDDSDASAAERKQQQQQRRKSTMAGGHGSVRKVSMQGQKATRWEDSRTAILQRQKEEQQRLQQQQQSMNMMRDTVRESQQAAAEAADREEEKSKMLARDPLAILTSNDTVGGTNNAALGATAGLGNNMNNSNVNEDGSFDLRNVENSLAAHLEIALHEIQEEIQKTEGNEELHKKAVAQKESLEALIDKLGGLEAFESGANNAKASVLLTNPKFHPLLFLTLCHRKTTHKQLIASMDRLSSKTENQAEQLQNLVRDNFPLFVRCAEGFEEFRKNSQGGSSTTAAGGGKSNVATESTVHERIDKLEAIAESAAFQAKKSFKPLLDNTSEVRKVQSALSVLSRVAPILQVPQLMRQHMENRRYSQALKTYRRCLVIDEKNSCNISLLYAVKRQAEQCVRDARKDLERRLTLPDASVEDLLDGIRDLGELIELDVSPTTTTNEETEDKKKKHPSRNSAIPNDLEDVVAEQSPEDVGIYKLGETTIHIRDHPPALACLLLQAAHFSQITSTQIDKTAETCQRIYDGESLTVAYQDKKGAVTATGGDSKKNKNDDDKASTEAGDGRPATNKGNIGNNNQWKYDVLDARVLSTIRTVDTVRVWLPRLIRIGMAAREEEKRRAAKIGHRSTGAAAATGRTSTKEVHHLSAFEVFVSTIAPSLNRLVEHAAFCSLGSNLTRTSGSRILEMTFGQNADDKLRTLLRSPLPPSQSNKVGKELALLMELVEDGDAGVDALRPEGAMHLLTSRPLDACKTLGDAAVVTIEKRRCIYAFDVCSRACSNRASGSGKFDSDALLQCLRNLADQLSRPEECSSEVEKGCELVIRRCCEGLASYVRDRGDDARLSSVAECADVMAERISEVIQEASFFLEPNKAEALKEVVLEDIMGLESAMFDEYLESIRLSVASSVRVGWLDKDVPDGVSGGELADGQPPSFPAYLSASLLSIVRCRAQVEQTLGGRIRQCEGVTYQHLSMATVADGVVEGICNEILQRKLKLKVRQADRLANEFEFLNNTLKKFLGTKAHSLLESTLQMVSSKAGRGRDMDGPDGLAALEELERLGRVYVLCLGGE
jgi:hypothetical protein